MPAAAAMPFLNLNGGGEFGASKSASNINSSNVNKFLKLENHSKVSKNLSKKKVLSLNKKVKE